MYGDEATECCPTDKPDLPERGGTDAHTSLCAAVDTCSENGRGSPLARPFRLRVS